MKKFFILITVLFCCSFLQAQTYTLNNNVYKSTTSSITKGDTLVTPYFYEDSKGIQHPIIVGSTGSCYIWKTSQKTGRKYRQYLGPEISQDICNKVNRRYNPKKK